MGLREKPLQRRYTVPDSELVGIRFLHVIGFYCQSFKGSSSMSATTTQNRRIACIDVTFGLRKSLILLYFIGPEGLLLLVPYCARVQILRRSRTNTTLSISISVTNVCIFSMCAYKSHLALRYSYNVEQLICQHTPI
jgi:hypothetical protein